MCGYIENIVEKEKKLFLREISPLFHNILLPVCQISILKQEPDFDFEISRYLT